MVESFKFLSEGTDFLKNPALLHTNYNEALNSARQQLMNKVGLDDRMYILKNKFHRQRNTKEFVVVYNKTLLSQVPDYEKHGYRIQGWISRRDGTVIRKNGGKYVRT